MLEDCAALPAVSHTADGPQGSDCTALGRTGHLPPVHNVVLLVQTLLFIAPGVEPVDWEVRFLVAPAMALVLVMQCTLSKLNACLGLSVHWPSRKIDAYIEDRQGQLVRP